MTYEDEKFARYTRKALKLCLDLESELPHTFGKELIPEVQWIRTKLEALYREKCAIPSVEVDNN